MVHLFMYTLIIISLDHIETVTLNGPLIAAVNTQLSYGVKVTSKFGTNYTGPITYSWNFQDGTTGTGATVSHTYHNANKYGIIYAASNPVGSKANITTVLIEESMMFYIVNYAAGTYTYSYNCVLYTYLIITHDAYCSCVLLDLSVHIIL